MSKFFKNSSPSLKKNIIWAGCLFSLFISLAFSAVNFIVAYAIEDSFFEHLIKEEAQYIQLTYKSTGNIVQPRKSFMTLVDNIEDFPQDLLAAYQKAPHDKEFQGENAKHYHLFYLKNPNKILIAEVSDYLVVRPLRTNIFTLLLCLSAFMFIIALGLAYVLAKRATAPVTQLATLLTSTSPENLPTDFSRNYPKNEIGLLANKLEEAMRRIKAFILREQHFTRDTSHELRTPITIIKNALELLNHKEINQEEKALVERITLANNQMEQTINTLLSLARENNEENTAEKILLLPSVENAIIAQSPLLANKEIELDIRINSQETVACSMTVLQILLNNLLSNAFQYTDQGVIYIAFENNTLKVGDTSGGIDEAIKSTATSALVKGKNSQGFGIGLSLVQRLCEKYKLELTLTSSATGVTVTIIFP